MLSEARDMWDEQLVYFDDINLIQNNKSKHKKCDIFNNNLNNIKYRKHTSMIYNYTNYLNKN